MSAASPTEQGGEAVLEALADQPGGAVLLALAEEREDLVLVGGAVRDLLLDLAPRELDVTVESGAGELAEELAERLKERLWEGTEPPAVTLHARFETASVSWIDGRIDIACRRKESYASPGALPLLEWGDVQADLARRDFTVNGIALPLSGPQRGELQAVDHALEDLAAGRLRVLREASFVDDPTRLLRLSRYSARLGFEIEEQTLRLAREALAGGALKTVSGGRLATELWLATGESTPCEAFAVMGELGVLAALGLPQHFDGDLALDAMALLPEEGLREVVVMAVAFHPPKKDTTGSRKAGKLMSELEFPAETRERVLAGAFGVSALAQKLERAARPSQLRDLLAGLPVEAIAIAGALGAESSSEVPLRVKEWLTRLRDVRLQISGENLLSVGVPQGPEVGKRLSRALELKLDGELEETMEAEMKAALEAQV